MKKTIRLTESELIKVIKRIIKEEYTGSNFSVDQDVETMPYKKKTGFDPDEILRHIKELQKKDEERRRRIQREKEKEEKERHQGDDDNEDDDDELMRPE